MIGEGVLQAAVVTVAPGASYVGQVANLRPIANRPGRVTTRHKEIGCPNARRWAEWQRGKPQAKRAGKGRLAIDRRLATCPTQP